MADDLLQITFRVPTPPSVNKLYDGGMNVRRRFKSDEYKNWCAQAGRFVMAFLADWKKDTGKEFATITQRCQVVYRIGEFDDNRRRDCSNYEKALSDLLVSEGILDDDCLIRRNTQEWADDVPAGIVEIHLTNI